MRKEAEKILDACVSDSDVRWRGYKDKIIDAMIEFKALNQGQSLPIDGVINCSWCDEEIKVGEADFIHKKGCGCCEKTNDYEPSEDHGLFTSTDCDPE